MSLSPDAVRENENARRMRDFNRAFAHARYLQFDEPEPPLLLTADGTERRYVLRASGARNKLRPAPGRIGAGPDRWGYHMVTAADEYQPGEFFHDPATGGVWCRVEAPSEAGSFQPVWLRVT